MNSPQEREEALFRAAVELSAVAARRAFLDQACAGDPALRQRLEALLAAHEQPETALNNAASGATVRRDELHESQTKDQGLTELGPPMDEAVGQTIGRYKLLERLGQGGCGVVYVAEQTEPVRRRVALKVIKLGMDTKAVAARFEAERQALAMMDHPNIARVLDAGATENGRPFFVMELVRGIKITGYCDQNSLSTEERLDLFIKVCQAIQHAHQKGIIHRDIKPSNILVTLHDGVPVPKVIDFGIAKATEGRLTDATVYTQLHQFIGTPAYMSPEQAEMSGLDIDTRSDIYSLGVLLYELLTGKTPFDASELMSQGIDVMRKTIREKEPVRPSTRLATLQGEERTTTAKRHAMEMPRLIHQMQGDLDWIVMKCLEKDRTRRYETANGLVTDLKRHLVHEPVLARPPSTVYRFQKAFRRNKLVFTAAAVVAAVLVAGIAVSTWQAMEAQRAHRDVEVARLGEREQRLDAQAAQRTAESERERADNHAQKATLSQQQSRRLLYAADINLAQQSLLLNNLGRARRLLDRHRPLPGEEDLRGWEWRYLWQLTRSGALATLTNRPSRGFDVSFSPDGTRLAVGWFDGQVDLWDVAERRWLRALTEPAGSYQAHVSFSPVRNLVAATSQAGVVQLHDLDTGTATMLWEAPSLNQWQVRDISFCQDGSRVVIYAGSTPANGDAVWVVNTLSTKTEFRQPTLYSDTFHHGAARLSPDNQRLYVARSSSGNYRYRIQCVEVSTGQELWQTETHRDYGLTALAISPDGRVLASGSGFEDPGIRIWEAGTGRLLTRLDGHTGWVGKLAFTRDGSRLVSAAADQSIRFWDTGTWRETKVLRGHTDEVHAVAVSETAKLVASAGKDRNLLLWGDDERSATDGYFRLPESARRGQVWAMDDARLLWASDGEQPAIVDLRGFPLPAAMPDLGPAAKLLGVFQGKIICRWDGTSQIFLHELRGNQWVQRGAIPVRSGKMPAHLVFNAARQLLAWNEDSSVSVSVVSLTAPERRVELDSDVPGFLPFKFSEDGSYLVAVSSEMTAGRIWNVESGQVVASLQERATDMAFALSGRVAVATVPLEEGHEVVFCDLANPGRSLRRVSGKEFPRSLAVSPDGNLVAVSTLGGLVRLFDPAKGEQIDALHGHLNAAFGVAFSPDGKRLISASGGREAIILWDVATRQALLTLSGTGSFLSAAEWGPGGAVILAGSPWQAWRAPSWEEIAAAESRENLDNYQP